MTKQQEIKAECELHYKNISLAQKRLQELRKECKHPNTFEGKYSWRVGCIDDAIICSDCGELIKYVGLNGQIENFTGQSETYGTTN